jgi:hypothetical protein
MKLIPEDGVDLNVTAATQVPTITDGGPGLEHLQGLFEVQDGDSPSSSINFTEGPSTNPRMIELNVQRAGMYPPPLSYAILPNTDDVNSQ